MATKPEALAKAQEIIESAGYVVHKALPDDQFYMPAHKRVRISASETGANPYKAHTVDVESWPAVSQLQGGDYGVVQIHIDAAAREATENRKAMNKQTAFDERAKNLRNGDHVSGGGNTGKTTYELVEREFVVDAAVLAGSKKGAALKAATKSPEAAYRSLVAKPYIEQTLAAAESGEARELLERNLTIDNVMLVDWRALQNKAAAEAVHRDSVRIGTKGLGDISAKLASIQAAKAEADAIATTGGNTPVQTAANAR